MFSFKNHAENVAGRPVLDLLLFSEKASCKVKSSGQHDSFICFGRPHCILDCLSRISSISIFYEKGLGLAPQKHFA